VLRVVRLEAPSRGTKADSSVASANSLSSFSVIVTPCIPNDRNRAVGIRKGERSEEFTNRLQLPQYQQVQTH